MPTMFDVARRAGVSHQTVSRVLNDLTGVAASTRLRVEQAIAELSYTPSPAARAMAKRRSGSIGLIQAGRPDYGPSNAALGFNEAAHEAGYTVTQASMRSLDAEVLRQAVHRLALQRVEAIVLISGEREGVGVLTGIDAGVPLVVVASEPTPGLHRVSMDQYAGARLATEHLIGLGHREIRHVTGPVDSMDAAERRRGWTDAMAAHGLDVQDPIEGDWLAASGDAAGRASSRTAPRPRCSSPTTRCRSGCCTPATTPACACPTTSASSGSTTSPRRRSSRPRSRPCARTSSRSGATS